MSKPKLVIDNYVGGRFNRFPDSELISIKNFDGTTSYEIALSTTWSVEAAIETATRIQSQLEHLPIEVIFQVLKKAMGYFFSDSSYYEMISKITGSSVQFCADSIEAAKEWCRNIDRYYNSISEQKKYSLHQTAPVFVILPKNSEVEMLFVIAEVMLSKNACIFRPSIKGAGTFTCFEFINALNKAIDALKSPKLEPLRSLISIVHVTSQSDYLSQLALDGWNFVAFGSDETLSKIKKTLDATGKPRKFVPYGTGLSVSIVLNDVNFKKYLNDITESIITNKGDECDATKILYVEESIYSSFLEKLRETMLRAKPGIYGESALGVITADNAHYIEDRIKFQGHKDDICFVTNEHGEQLMHSALIPIHEFELAEEMPGPVVYVRCFGEEEELQRLMQKDLLNNGMDCNLVVAVYTEEKEKYLEILPLISSHKIKHNKPTHVVDFMEPHQGMHLSRELSMKFFVDK